MRFNKLKAILKNSGIRSDCSPPRSGHGGRPTDHQSDPRGRPQRPLPDGSTVPMWGYSCGTPVSWFHCDMRGIESSAGTGWSPVVITVPMRAQQPHHQSDQQPVLHARARVPNTIPTSLTIVGQVGGGLGTAGPAWQVRPTPAPDRHLAYRGRTRIVCTAATRAACAVVRHRSGGGSDDGTDLECPPAGHVSA